MPDLSKLQCWVHSLNSSLNVLRVSSQYLCNSWLTHKLLLHYEVSSCRWKSKFMLLMKFTQFLTWLSCLLVSIDNIDWRNSLPSPSNSTLGFLINKKWPGKIRKHFIALPWILQGNSNVTWASGWGGNRCKLERISGNSERECTLVLE